MYVTQGQGERLCYLIGSVLNLTLFLSPRFANEEIESRERALESEHWTG